MKVKNVIVGLGTLGVFYASSIANDDKHLLPEDSLYSAFNYKIERSDLLEQYDENVLWVFQEAFADDVFGRVIVHPSFQNEYAVAVKRNEDKFSVLVLEPTVHIWRYSLIEMYESGRVRILDDEDGSKLKKDLEELREGLPESLTEVPVESCEYELSANLGEHLFELWGEMLFRTRYPDKRPVTLDGESGSRIGFDGVTYHFSFEYDHDRLAGKIWSPDSKSETGKFVEITNLLSGACQNKDSSLVDKAQNETEKLLARLRQSAY